jgi:acylpyruvate hydrolase
MKDVTCPDGQRRTIQWLQGKTFEGTMPIGPWLARDTAATERPDFELSCEDDGELMQSATTNDLVFDPCDLVSCVSTIATLVPRDVIATGTPGGVGDPAKRPRYLSDGATLVARIARAGEFRNHFRYES